MSHRGDQNSQTTGNNSQELMATHMGSIARAIGYNDLDFEGPTLLDHNREARINENDLEDIVKKLGENTTSAINSLATTMSVAVTANSDSTTTLMDRLFQQLIKNNEDFTNKLTENNTNTISALTENNTNTISALTENNTNNLSTMSSTLNDIHNKLADNNANADIRMDQYSQKLLDNDIYSNHRMEQLIEKLIANDSSANIYTQQIINNIQNSGSDSNREIQTLIETIVSRDVSSNSRIENIFNKLIQNDVSANNRMQEISIHLSNLDASANYRMETLINKLSDIDASSNNRTFALIENIITRDASANAQTINMINKISNSDTSSNLYRQEIIDKITQSDNNFNNQLINVLTQIKENDTNSSLNTSQLIQKLIDRDISNNEQTRELVIKLSDIDASSNEYTRELVNKLANNDISFNNQVIDLFDRINVLDASFNSQTISMLEKLAINDISSNNRTELLINTLKNIDLSSNERFELLVNKLSNIDISQNDNINTLVNMLSDIDNSSNIRTINMIDKLSNNNTNDNIRITNLISDLITKLNNADISSNVRTNNMVNDIVDKIHNSDISSNIRTIDMVSEITNKLTQNDISSNIRTNALVDDIINKLSQVDVSSNIRTTNMVNDFCNKLADIDNSSNNRLINALQTMSLIDNSANNRTIQLAQTLAQNDASSNSRTIQMIQKLHDNDISANNRSYQLIEEIKTSRENLINKLTQNDTSANSYITNLINTINTNHQSNVDIISNNHAVAINTFTDKMNAILSTFNTLQEDNNDNLIELMNSLNIKSNDTQQQLQEYIGKYIVIPLYEQRLNDASIMYFKMLERKILCVIDDYLIYFKKGAFADLVMIYDREKQIKMASAIYDIKQAAFEKFVSLSPGATCFADMNEEAVEHYKSFRKYISWSYKTLDGINKAVTLWKEYTNLQAQLSIACQNTEILDNEELLNDYINELNTSKQTQFGLFSSEATVDMANYTLRPEIEEYIKRYGVPEQLDFDAEKIAGIIKDLEAAGIVLNPDVTEICSSSGLSSSEKTPDCTSNTETETECDTTTDCEKKSSSNNLDSDNTPETDYTDNDTPSNNTPSDNSPSNDTPSDQDCTPCDSKSESDLDSIARTLSSSDFGDTGDTKSCSFSEDDLCNEELGIQCNYATYFVYVAMQDPLHALQTFYYPLFLSKDDALDANDSSNSDVVSLNFAQHPNIIFWMPKDSYDKAITNTTDCSNTTNSAVYGCSLDETSGVGCCKHPPLSLEYIHFTNNIGASGIYYRPISKNKTPRRAFSFELANISYFNYLTTAPTVAPEQQDPIGLIDEELMTPWVNTVDSSKNNWKNMFMFKSQATNVYDIFNKEIVYSSNQEQWLNFNLLTVKEIDNGTNKESIAFNFIKYMSKSLYNSELLYLVFKNLRDIFNEFEDNIVNDSIKEKLVQSDISGQDGTMNIAVMPSTILSQLAHNPQFGHKRIQDLLDSRNGDLNKFMPLLEEGDEIVFVIAVNPQNPAETQTVVPPKRYKITLRLISGDPNDAPLQFDDGNYTQDPPDNDVQCV